MPQPRVLAVIPARGNSRGLPGKNLRPFAGLPLIVHSIQYAQRIPLIERVIVSTDSPEIATVARAYRADVPFMRPAELSTDTAPTWPVLQHALEQAEARSGRYDLLVLLEPTSPARRLSYVTEGLQLLAENAEADGLVAVSQPDFNPLWRGVINRDGWMEDLSDLASRFERRQDVPTI